MGLCMACHQENGRGQEKLAPSLIGSQFALAAPSIPIRILLPGKRGGRRAHAAAWRRAHRRTDRGSAHLHPSPMGQRGLGGRSEHREGHPRADSGAHAAVDERRAPGDRRRPRRGSRATVISAADVLRSPGQRLRRGRFQSGRPPGGRSASRVRTARGGRRRRLSRDDHHRRSGGDVPAALDARGVSRARSARATSHCGISYRRDRS